MSGDLFPATEHALLHRTAVEQAKRRVPSLVTGVVRDGRLVWAGARGRVAGAKPTEDTQYRIGSITKTFVAVLVMRLRDEGRLTLSDPLDRHLSGTPIGDRTIRQLLSHTSGLTAESPGDWWERTPGVPWPELADRLDADVVRLDAARRFHYSNLGFGVLGELVARMRGSSWLDAVQKEILDPLGMRRTTPMPQAPHADGIAVHPWADVLLPEPDHDARAMAPAGQLWSTATDLARWVAFLGGDTGGLLSEDTLAEMREPAAVEESPDWTGGMGLGVQLRRDRGRRLTGHGGSMPGFLASVWVDPKDRLGALMLANTTTGMSGDLTLDLIDLVATHEPRIPDEWVPLPEVDQDLLDLTGPWYWGPAPYAIRLRPNRWLELITLSDRGRESRFRPEADGTWTGLDGYHAGERLRVVRRPDNSVSHLDLNTFIFTRTPYDPSAPIPGGVDPSGWGPGHLGQV